MRRFELLRRDRPGDPPLAEGVQFSDTATAVRWLNRSTEVWDLWDEPAVDRVIERTYGGAVEVVWLDPPPAPGEGPGLRLVPGGTDG